MRAKTEPSPHAGGLRLATARLALREWRTTDVPDLVEGLNDLRVSQWLASVPHPYGISDAERWLALCSRLHQEGPSSVQYEFAIEVLATRKVVGGVSLTRVDRAHGTWIGIELQVT